MDVLSLVDGGLELLQHSPTAGQSTGQPGKLPPACGQEDPVAYLPKHMTWWLFEHTEVKLLLLHVASEETD